MVRTFTVTIQKIQKVPNLVLFRHFHLPIFPMKRQIASSYTSRNVRRKTESASGLPASKASDSSPPASTPTSDTLAPDLESLTTHTQDSSVSAEDFESDEPSSEETSSLGSDSNSSSSGEDSNDEEDDAAQSSEFELSNNPTPRNGITQYADDSGITTLRAGRKPVMSSSKLPKGPATLLDKVRQFLPQLEAANSALEAAKAAGTLGEQSMEMEDDSDEETYIEMVILGCRSGLKHKGS
jgi:hypothetical protein